VKHELFPLSELEPGTMRAASVEGLELVIARSKTGSVHAFRDRCAHSGARLSRGKLIRMIDGDEVDHHELTETLVIRCPWHGYEYDLEDGRCVADPKHVRVRKYAVVVENDTVWLER
jgi:3-phenylpropionate/trans-cinnamate dioxygenase ferredoxin subunit